MTDDMNAKAQRILKELARMVQQEGAEEAIKDDTPPKKMLSDADCEALLRIPIVERIECLPGEVKVHLRAFTAKDVDGLREGREIPHGSHILILDDAHIDASFRLLVRDIPHPNMRSSGRPCWGNARRTAEALILRRKYAELIALTCEFLQVYCKEGYAPQQIIGWCADCAYRAHPLIPVKCGHPPCNERWTVPCDMCTFFTPREG